MYKEIGLEIEAFVLNEDKEIVDPSDYGLPIDESGYLLEVRTDPHRAPHYLFGDIIGRLQQITEELQERSLTIDLVDYHRPTRKEKEKFLIDHGKHPEKTFSIYSKTGSINFNLWTAGLHVHFSEESMKYITKDQREITFYNQVNIPFIVRSLDEIFKDQIKRAKRRMGLYRLKTHGFEYRSLPSSIVLVPFYNKDCEAIYRFCQVLYRIFWNS